MILASNSAEETSKLIDLMETEDPEKFRKVAGIKYCRDSWRQNRLSEHDFMHRVKVMVDNEIDDSVRHEARQFVAGVLESRRKK